MGDYVFKRETSYKWLEVTAEANETIAQNCTAAVIDEALVRLGGQLGGARVEAIEHFDELEGLPIEHYKISILHHTRGIDVRYFVYLPVVWNRRYLGIHGGGTRTALFYGNPGEGMSISVVYDGLANGFATSHCDGGLAPEFDSWKSHHWALREDGSLDYERLMILAYLAGHWNALVGKAVATAVYGEPPAYSYAMGSSNGGRMVLKEAQMYPDDYDGYLAIEPALKYTDAAFVYLWPIVVQQCEKHIVTPAKWDAIFQSQVEASGGTHGYIENAVNLDFDFGSCIGKETEDGPITEEDVRIVRKVYGGLTDEQGNVLVKSYTYGARFWNNVPPWGSSVHYDAKTGGYEMHVFDMGHAMLAHWLERDPDWQEAGIDYPTILDMLRRFRCEFSALNADDPDLARLAAGGAKLVISHTDADMFAFTWESIDYYRAVAERMGGEQDLDSFVRFYLTPGCGHGELFSPGMGLTKADGMIAVMDWVENGVAPEEIDCYRYDLQTQKAIAKGKVKPYRVG